MMRKWLILLCALSTVACTENREEVVPEGTRTFVELAVVMHEEYYQVAEACEVEVEEGYMLEGCALFSWDEQGIVSDCEVHLVAPTYVDDAETLTLGHEVLHCIYGLYHEE